MIIKTKRRYSSELFEWMELIGWHLTVPWKYFTDHFLSCFLPVTVELKKPWRRFPTLIIFLPLTFSLSLVTLPLAVIGFILIVPIRHKRLPYLFSYVQQQNENDLRFNRPLKNTYCISTTNICLLPDYMSRFNNLHDTYRRSRKIADKLVQDQIIAERQNEDKNGESKTEQNAEHAAEENTVNGYPGVNWTKESELFPNYPKVAPPETAVKGTTEDFETDILEKFPETDIFIIQVWCIWTELKVLASLFCGALLIIRACRMNGCCG